MFWWLGIQRLLYRNKTEVTEIVTKANNIKEKVLPTSIVPFKEMLIIDKFMLAKKLDIIGKCVQETIVYALPMLKLDFFVPLIKWTPTRALAGLTITALNALWNLSVRSIAGATYGSLPDMVKNDKKLLTLPSTNIVEQSTNTEIIETVSLTNTEIVEKSVELLSSTEENTIELKKLLTNIVSDPGLTLDNSLEIEQTINLINESKEIITNISSPLVGGYIDTSIQCISGFMSLISGIIYSGLSLNNNIIKNYYNFYMCDFDCQTGLMFIIFSLSTVLVIYIYNKRNNQIYQLEIKDKLDKTSSDINNFKSKYETLVKDFDLKDEQILELQNEIDKIQSGLNIVNEIEEQINNNN